MRNFHSAAAICVMLTGAMPVVAAAQANHNTARSNKSTVAAPAENAAPDEGSGEELRAGKKGYDYYQARSDMASVTEADPGSGQPADDGSVAGTAASKQTQGASFGERVNAGARHAGDADAPGSASTDHSPSETGRQGLQDADKGMPSIIR